MSVVYEHPRPQRFPTPLRYGPLELPSRYLLSPLAGYTNLPFRRIVRQLGGVGLTTTDLVNATAILQKNERTLGMIESHPEDRPFAVQIFGSDPSIMVEAAAYLEEIGIDSVDINMGCPVRRITSGGSGSAMMCQREETITLVERIVQAVKIPVTVKMRLGWDDTQITAPEFAAAFEQAGVAAIAIHGRTREQGFSGTVNLDGIARVAAAVKHVPVIGNGDVRTVPDAARMLAVTGCQGVSVGRGALANPWIFRQLNEWEQTGQYRPAGTFMDRLELLRRQFGYLEERHGVERAIVMFRKMGHWYLKGMRVKARYRHEFQTARSRFQLDAALAAIAEDGPAIGTRDGILPDLYIPVPSGPVEKW